MKFFIILLTLSFICVAKYVNFYFPEDSNHFIYFLEKKLSKKKSKFLIRASSFNIPTLNKKIINNKSSKFIIYINEKNSNRKSIMNLALYKNIEIYLCKNIKNSTIEFSNMILKSTLSFDEKIFKHKKGSTYIRKNDQKKILLNNCYLFFH